MSEPAKILPLALETIIVAIGERNAAIARAEKAEARLKAASAGDAQKMIYTICEQFYGGTQEGMDRLLEMVDDLAYLAHENGRKEAALEAQPAEKAPTTGEVQEAEAACAVIRSDLRQAAEELRDWLRYEDAIITHLHARIQQWIDAGYPYPQTYFTAGLERQVANMIASERDVLRRQLVEKKTKSVPDGTTCRACGHTPHGNQVCGEDIEMWPEYHDNHRRCLCSGTMEVGDVKR